MATSAALKLVDLVRSQAQLQRRLALHSRQAFAEHDLAAFAELQREREAAWAPARDREQRLRELVKLREPLPDDALSGLIEALAMFDSWSFTALEWVPLEALAKLVRRSLNGGKAPPELAQAMAELAERRLAEGGRAEARRAAAILAEAPGGVREADGPAGLIDRADDWGMAAGNALDGRGGEASAWLPLLEHAATATASKPSQRWLRTAGGHIDALGDRRFADLARCLLGALDAPPSGEMRRGAGIGALVGLDHLPRAVPTEANATLLRGLVWACSLRGDADMARLVADAARACQRKLPDVGARCPRVVNACLWSLAAMPGEAGAEHLVALHAKARKPAARARVEAALTRAAETAGVSRAVLEDRAVPSFGLESGPLAVRAGKATGEITVTPPGHVVQHWRSAAGKPLARPPKALPRELRDLRSALTVQRARFERLLAAGTARPWARYRDGVLAHPVTAAVAANLIVDAGEGGAFLPAAGRPSLVDDAEVRLWHPAGKPVGDVVGWRDRLSQQQLVQPFKQAHREVYLLTPAEREAGDRSPRFAGSVVRQHALAAICAPRGWRYRLQGPFDPGGDPYPTLALPEHGLVAELELDRVEDEALTSGHAIFLYARTGSLRFLRDRTPLPLEQVPQLALSETLRDVDLFVSVAGIAADPAWALTAPGDWPEQWRRQAFSELTPLGERRREVLEQALPGLPIADRASLEGHFLLVWGSRGSYRIHLGSGNVLMEPGSRALCIIASGGGAIAGEPGHLWLPFEGDTMLAVILSKALLLADDANIADPAIRAQIDA